MTRGGEKKVGRGMERTSMCHLPTELVHEIFTRVPITSLRSVRSTCKLWDALTKDWILGKAVVARQQFLGFMTKDSKVCSIRFHLCRSNDKDKEDDDLLDLSVKQVDFLNHVKISRVFHSNGLLLCIAMDNLRLLMWNPYLGQTQWIGLTPGFDRHDDCYALGYDINRKPKILSFLNYSVPPELIRYEIYDFSSNSWRVPKVNLPPLWWIKSHPSGVSLKGNTYFCAEERTVLETYEDGSETDMLVNFLLCFDFTTERFGPRLLFPHDNDFRYLLTLSCVREEKLAVLYIGGDGFYDNIYIWVTTTIEPNHVSWSLFLSVEMEPFALTRMMVCIQDIYYRGSFFIDEEEKIAVYFDLDGSLIRGIGDHHHTAFVIGEGGFFKSVCLGVAQDFMKCFCSSKFSPETRYCIPRVCSSSYLPCLVQLNQPRKGEDKLVISRDMRQMLCRNKK